MSKDFRHSLPLEKNSIDAFFRQLILPSPQLEGVPLANHDQNTWSAGASLPPRPGL